MRQRPSAVPEARVTRDILKSESSFLLETSVRTPMQKGGLRKVTPKPLHVKQISFCADNVEDLVWSKREVLSEGELVTVAQGDLCYAGSTMISVDIAFLFTPLKTLERKRLENLLSCSPVLHLRAMRLAVAEASRRSAHALGTARIHTDARIDENLLLLDLDLEAPVLKAASNEATREHDAPR